MPAIPTIPAIPAVQLTLKHSKTLAHVGIGNSWGFHLRLQMAALKMTLNRLNSFEPFEQAVDRCKGISLVLGATVS